MRVILDPDPHLCLTDLSPTRDPTPFFSYFKDAKKNVHTFLITYPEAHYLQSLIYCLKDKFIFKILFCKHYFNSLNTFLRKEEDPDPDPCL
jgi:hypothetical protein